MASSRRIARTRRGRSTASISTAATKFATEAITSVRCQLPVRAARMLPMGTKNAAQPFAV